MICPVALCALLVSQPPARPEPAKRLDEWAGRWVVADAGSSAAQACPADLVGLTKKGAEVAVKGNQITVGGKVLATLTTDFSGTGLDLDKAVWVERRPVLLTAPSGRGVLCAYQVFDGGLELCYPHTQRRVDAGTRIYLQRPKE